MVNRATTLAGTWILLENENLDVFMRERRVPLLVRPVFKRLSKVSVWLDVSEDGETYRQSVESPLGSHAREFKLGVEFEATEFGDSRPLTGVARQNLENGDIDIDFCVGQDISHTETWSMAAGNMARHGSGIGPEDEDLLYIRWSFASSGTAQRVFRRLNVASGDAEGL